VDPDKGLLVLKSGKPTRFIPATPEDEKWFRLVKTKSEIEPILVDAGLSGLLQRI
jgi:hypothetical protein